MNKEQKRILHLQMSTHFWLVLFAFAVLVVSMIVAGLMWQLFVRIGILMPFEPGSHMRAFFFLLVVSMLIGTVLSTLGGVFILRPLRRLTLATKEITRGNFNVQVSVKGSTEIERLAVSFNEMAKELSGIETLRADFVSNISHEFKTPVASIRGFAKRLLKGNLTEEQRIEHLKIIVNESERLTRLSSNVLLLSNLEACPTKLGRETYSLDEQLRKLVLLLEPQLQKKGLETEIQLDSTQIYAGEEMLDHVWLNLLGNAIKFSHHGGLIGLTLEKKDGEAVVTVYDGGIGMDEYVKKRMFEKFFQADRSRATDGNGLGLSLVKKIVDLESGYVDVESEQGSGTRITVVLPIRQVEKS